MRIGAHLSVSQGYVNTLDYAEKVGCESIQIFAKSPRRWSAPPPDLAAGAAFAQARAQVVDGLPLFTHTSYLINLATVDDEAGVKSVHALADELTRAAILRADGVVTHLGNDTPGQPELAAKRVAERIAQAYEAAGLSPDQVVLLLENTAGAGAGFGCCPHDIGLVFHSLEQSLQATVGVCLDTCHAHAFGVDLSTPQAWRTYVSEWESLCREGCIKVIHANDAIFERGSRRDRHAWIGEGQLGVSAFESMFVALGDSDISVITEMPGEAPEKDVVNIEKLKSMREMRSSETL
ncbi:MAG: deoxyribonuclease IV [Actinobacteria bacterium]|nr:deoxyribonuclease IV [Actinomycetota bacterium]